MSEAAVLEEIANRVGTPAYVYDAPTLARNVARWTDAVGTPASIHFAVKANSNLGVLRRLATHGISFEVGTEGEYARVRAAGVPPGRLSTESHAPSWDRDAARPLSR